MDGTLEALRGEVLHRLEQTEREAELEQLRVEVLGRSGSLTQRLRGLKDLPAEERPAAGQELNELRRLIEARLDERLQIVRERARSQALESERVDITLPGSRW